MARMHMWEVKRRYVARVFVKATTAGSWRSGIARLLRVYGLGLQDS